MSTMSQLRIPIFAGHGTTSINSPLTRQQALRDAASPTSSLLSSTCHEVFLTELSTLSSSQLDRLGIDISDFRERDSLLSPLGERYLHNPVVSGSLLFLVQMLRYITHVQAAGVSCDSLTSFSDVLQENIEHNIGVLGFSSGVLPACVVATSFSAVTFVSRAVEVFRLAVWIGIRTQVYRLSALNAVVATATDGKSLPWGMILHGMSKYAVQEAIFGFCGDVEMPTLYITAVMNENCVTVSGRPDILEAFSKSLPVGCVAHRTTLDTLYHSPHLEDVRQQVLADVTRRKIQFPAFSDIKAPIRSTFTGEILDESTATSSLVELVVDMILLQPVNWDKVVRQLLNSRPTNVSMQLINVGPGVGLARALEKDLSTRVSFLDIRVPDPKGDRRPEPRKQEPIAIVGMSVNMPGAPDASRLWHVLEHGINMVTEIPEHRFKVSEYINPSDTKSTRRMNAHTGNFIEGVDEFDNKFFNISPREAMSMDPQQRILLHSAYDALEDSGYVPSTSFTNDPKTFGCYIGVATHDYIQNLRKDIDVYYSTGTLRAYLSGRISYAMQLSGPSIVVDTACSSSIVAVYQACRALTNGDCNAALAGGVNIISSPDMFIGLDRGHFLSPTGQCKAFDESADGYSRGEGCGLFVLKRLSDAVAENDNILGIIRGIEVNQSGLAHSITHPHPPSQMALFNCLLEKSNIHPHRVNCVEAHGTGTQAGDPNELASIRKIFAAGRPAENPLHITSVKANIGHLEAASGVAGLAKLLLMMRHGTIPKQISLHRLNPRIAPLDSDNTSIDIENTLWSSSHLGMSRMSMLNNFGAAGSNAALLLEEYMPPSHPPLQPQDIPCVFGLSAKTVASLRQSLAKYLQWCQSSESQAVRLTDVAYTMTARRQAYAYRLAVSASCMSELIDKLPKATFIHVPEGITQIVFVFSGQGSQYLGMGRSLYQTSSLFNRHINECHQFLIASGFTGILPIIIATTTESGLSTSEEFEAYQTAIFALQYALAKLWISWGIFPSAVIGHSLGEYAALVIAQVLSLKDALTIVATRARLMVQRCAAKSTGMMAVNLEPATIQVLLESSTMFSSLSIACYNGPVDCVLSGPISTLELLKAHLDKEIRCKNVILEVSFGYHSSAMSPLLDDLNSLVRSSEILIKAPAIPIVSNVYGSVIYPGNTTAFNSTYFSSHCAEPVRFDQGITELMRDPTFANVGVWIEIGPHTPSLAFLKSNPVIPETSLMLGSLRKQQRNNPWATLTGSLSQLYTSNVNVRWRDVFSHLTSISCISLPAYPWDKSKFWVQFQEEPVAKDLAEPRPEEALISGYSMLHAWKQYPSHTNGRVALFETPIAKLSNFIVGHRVGGLPLCPASVYIELAFSGIQLAHRHLQVNSAADHHVVLRELKFPNPLVYDKSVHRIVTVNITIKDGLGTFSVSSHVDVPTEKVTHMKGEYKLHPILKTNTKFSRTLPAVSRRVAALIHPRAGDTTEVFSARTIYEVIFPRVVEYAKEYHTARSLTIDESGMEGFASVRIPKDHSRAGYSFHPVFVDTLLHVPGFITNMRGGIDNAYICTEVGSVKVIPGSIDIDRAYTVYCSNTWLQDEGIMLAEAYAVQDAAPNKIVAFIKGMQFRRVRLSSLVKGLGRAAGISISSPTRFEPSVTKGTRVSTASTQMEEDNDIRVEVIKLVAGACDIDPDNIHPHSELSSLGVDSLMSIEILSKLQTSFPQANINPQALAYCRTVADILLEISPHSEYLDPICDNSQPDNPLSGTSTPRTLVLDDDSHTLLPDGDPDVKQILASILNIKAHEITDDTDFESLGLDSLSSIEALGILKLEFGFDLPDNFFGSYTTARAIRSYFSTHLSTSATIPKALDSEMIQSSERSRIAKAFRLNVNPVPIQTCTSKSRSPLFLIHDGSGLVNYYDRLSPLTRTVFGLHNTRFLTAKSWESLDEMASAYAQCIIGVNKGPILLGGWSFGGIAAYELALQLAQKGIVVKGIVLIDSPSPIHHVPLTSSLIESVLSLNTRSSSTLLDNLVRSQFEMNSSLLGKYDPRPTVTSCPPLILLRSRDGYNPPGIIDVPRWLADRRDPKAAVTGWEILAGSPVKVLDMPGHHFQPFHPSNINEVSLRIIEACEYLENI